MADSDDEYVEVGSEEEVARQRITRGVKPTRAGPDLSSKWEVARPWDDVREDASGAIAVDELLEAGKRKRRLKDTTPLQRGIIRHFVLIIDCSIAMLETDMRPTRYLLTLRYAQEFVREFFEQNPISQLAIIGMRDGLAQRISDMSGNPADHITKLQGIRETEPKGQASLQNAFDMSRAQLYHAPTHTTREVLLLLGSLLSSDPGDIHQTINALVSTHITCTVIGLAAQIAICKTLVSKTNPSRPLSESYNVALDDIHYRELIMRATIPPPIASNAASSTSTAGGAQEIGGSTLLKMGFPSRITSPEITLCACHSKPTQGGYLCTRCSSKVCALPCECPICGLTLILSTHLARSYHHLFPLKNWKEVSWARVAESPEPNHCFSCLTPFPSKETAAQQKRAEAATSKDKPREKRAVTGLSESGRYECETCHSFFCLDCDIFAHEILHNCPGCQSRECELEAAAAAGQS